jgi:hypothetical protein
LLPASRRLQPSVAGLATVGGVVPVRTTLEVAAGTAQELDIRVGDKVLQKVFGNAS